MHASQEIHRDGFTLICSDHKKALDNQDSVATTRKRVQHMIAERFSQRTRIKPIVAVYLPR